MHPILSTLVNNVTDSMIVPPIDDSSSYDDTMLTTDNSSWPSLSHTTISLMIALNLGSLVAAYVLLRVIWPPPTTEQLTAEKELQSKITLLQRQYNTMQSSEEEIKECLEGDSAGEYNQPWTQTFDLVFVIIMIGGLLGLLVWSYAEHPELLKMPMFFLEQIPKVVLMMAVSLAGGFLCRYFCETDEKGYIITNRQSAFKVNYTRKLQHFAAYLVPLIMHTHAAESIRGPLTLAWGNWFTLLAFLILIKPLRERFTFVMLQFNSLDRPEDRPNTISWIVGGNILPGCILIIFFRWLYSFTGQSDMVYVTLFITGVGDGLAEPVGIYFGRHKYWTTSCFGDRKYQRSFEGSACVFISSIVFVSVFYYTFTSAAQFWCAMILLPPVMAYAEATSPHTIDTPFLMGLGGLLLFIISHIHILWG